MNQQMRVLIVDDHTLFRESLSRLLESETDCTIVGTCASVDDAVQIMKKDKIDLVMLDYDLGEQPGTHLLSEARKNSFDSRVLMVTGGMSEPTILRALDNGARGIFLKSSPLVELIQAIRRVIMGEIWVDPALMKSLLASARHRNPEEHREILSERERKVIRYVFEGLSNKEIGQQLNISEGSVKAALQQLFARTGVRSRSQLVRIAVEKHSHDWLNE
jgi:DNA-binding NarL/FixJ family response regulator